jgi:nitrogen fixation/metabolism regulation signal transduction histidine kinase
VRFWKRLELEWKILLLAAAVFIAIAWPVQHRFVRRIETILAQSVDTRLEPILRRELRAADAPADRAALAARLERASQWEALIPIVVREQRQIIFGFSVILFIGFVLAAIWSLRRLTQPLKDLAVAVEHIGKGRRVTVRTDSGGALGRVEQAVDSMQVELEALREKARVRGMEAAWKDIARVMAHEIKNPLTPIRLTLDRLEERTLTGETLEARHMTRALGRINKQVDVLEALVNQFRSFSREPEATIEPVALRDALEQVSETLAPSVTTAIQGDATVAADRLLLHQVALNLWKNALEAGADHVVVRIAREADQVRLEIADNGPGIPAGDLERIWLPYVSFKKGGTGLGLPVVKRLVETMHGTITLESRTGGPRRGLAAIVRLPAAGEDADE